MGDQVEDQAVVGHLLRVVLPQVVPLLAHHLRRQRQHQHHRDLLSTSTFHLLLFQVSAHR